MIFIKTRWTFFRVKLVFECEFEISWSLDPGTLEPLVLGTPPISSSYCPPWIWFGYGVCVCVWGGVGVSCDIGE